MGGLDDAWAKGGFSRVKDYVKGGFQELGEDILSGINGRASHGLYDPSIPLYSATNANAPLNFAAIREDAIHGAVGSATASLAHSIPRTAAAEAKRPLTPQDINVQRDNRTREILAKNPRMSRAAAEQQSNAIQRYLASGNPKDAQQISFSNPAVSDAFFNGTGVRITPADTRDPRILKNKLATGVRNYQERYALEASNFPQKRIDFPLPPSYTDTRAQPLPAGENAKYRNNFVIGTFAFRSPTSGPSTLRPNFRYETDNHSCCLYTDGAARLKLTSGELSVSGPGRYSRAKAEIERMFSAMVPDLTNPNSRYRELSQEAYAGLQQLKQTWTPALAAGKKIPVSIEMGYTGTSTIPDYYDVSYTIDGKESITRIYNWKRG